MLTKTQEQRNSFGCASCDEALNYSQVTKPANPGDDGGQNLSSTVQSTGDEHSASNRSKGIPNSNIRTGDNAGRLLRLSSPSPISPSAQRQLSRDPLHSLSRASGLADRALEEQRARLTVSGLAEAA
jgi:hypothetical protein